MNHRKLSTAARSSIQGRRWLLFLLAAPLTGGCATIGNFYNRLIGNTPNERVTPEQFVNRNATNDAPLSPVDQPGAINVDRPRAAPGNQGENVAPTHSLPANSFRGDDAVSPAVADTIKVPGERPSTLPTTLTSETPAVATSQQSDLEDTTNVNTGLFIPLGCVLAQVNGQPVYANKVLRLLAPTLKNDARQYDRSVFQLRAFNELTRQRDDLIRDEIDFAAADRNLDSQDKAIVQAITTAYRRKLVTNAGGSEEAAHNQAAVMGEDFDEKVHDEYRTNMIRMYYQKKFGSRTIPSADEMRAYYEHNSDRYSDPSEATFDVLVIDPANLSTDSPEKAHDLAFARAQAAQKAAAGQADFARIFVEYNNDPGMSAVTNGLGKWEKLQKGSFSIPEVEDAIWKLQPGQVTDVISTKGKLYVAKLETRKDGNTRAFDDEAVQNDISSTIQRQRIEQFRVEENDKLQRDNIVTRDDNMMDLTLNMAMQNYEVWRKAK